MNRSIEPRHRPLNAIAVAIGQQISTAKFDDLGWRLGAGSLQINDAQTNQDRLPMPVSPPSLFGLKQ